MDGQLPEVFHQLDNVASIYNNIQRPSSVNQNLRLIFDRPQLPF